MKDLSQYIDYTKQKIKIKTDKEESKQFITDLYCILDTLEPTIPDTLANKELTELMSKIGRKLINPNTKKIPSISINYYQGLAMRFVVEKYNVLGSHYPFFESIYFKVDPCIKFPL